MSSLQQGAVIAGRYRLERPLARGGMGSVWVARHLQLEIDVALKFMAQEHASSPEARARFEREARASARLRSPYVVQVLDYGAEDGTLFLAMELLQGEDLEARLRRLGPLSPAALASLVDHVCKALECAHDAGIIHRDLKPANIFLSRQGREEITKILDFGIAKSVGPELASTATKTGALVGSPGYMSPEQVRRSKDVDARSDLWSLGIILFRCLTGQLPFTGDELGDVLVAICSDPIPLASQVNPQIGPDVDRFFARALARSPNQRFQSARELASGFAEVVQATGELPGASGRPGFASAPVEGGALAGSSALGDFAGSPEPLVGAGAAPTTEPNASLALPTKERPSGSLAPSGATLATGLTGMRRGRLFGVLVAAFGVVVTLGLVALTLVRHSRSTDVAGISGISGVSGISGGTSSGVSSVPAAESVAPMPSSRPAPSLSVTAAPAPVSAAPPTSSAAPEPSVVVPKSASGKRPRSLPPAPRPPVKSVPTPSRPSPPARDPLEHL